MDYLRAILIFCAGACISEVQGTSQKQLLHDLFIGYDKRILPVLNRSHPVDVQLGLALHTIRDLDEKNQVLTIKAYFVFSWVDEFLVWNSTQYNTDIILVPLQDIWIPDAELYNSVNSFETIADHRSYIGVFPDGGITWTPAGDYSVLCDVSVWNYPFDSQTCMLEVGPKFSSYSMQVFTAMFNKLDLTLLRENSEWEFLSSDFKCRLSRFSISKCDIKITIQRRSAHFVLHLVSPVILLAVMNPVTFLIPPTSGERLSFGMALFLSFSFLMSSILDNLPVSRNEICYFTLFVQGMFWFGGVQCCTSCVITRLSSRSLCHPVPTWIPRVLCLSRNFSKNTQVACANNDSNVDSTIDVTVEVCSNSWTWIEVMLRLDFVLFIVFNILTIVIIVAVLVTIVPQDFDERGYRQD